jgi:hypothetical protein
MPDIEYEKMQGEYATSWKVASSPPDAMNEFFSMYLILPAALDPGINRNKYHSRIIMFLRSRERPVRKADNLTAIYELIV